MTSLGVWSCQWRELRPINFGGSSSGGTTTTENVEAGEREGGDDDQGFSRGRGRGRGRDGVGDYEMVSIKPEAETG